MRLVSRSGSTWRVGWGEPSCSGCGGRAWMKDRPLVVLVDLPALGRPGACHLSRRLSDPVHLRTQDSQLVWNLVRTLDLEDTVGSVDDLDRI
jgi:hypothetical protein